MHQITEEEQLDELDHELERGRSSADHQLEELQKALEEDS